MQLRTAVGQVGGVGVGVGAVRRVEEPCIVIDLTERLRRDAAVPVPVRRPAGAGVGPQGGGLVLTRRGVLVMRLLAAVLAGLVLAGGLLGASLVARADDVRRAPAGTVHVVMPGDTLWRIAREEAPGVDPREAVRQLAEVNHLSAGQGLEVGVRLFVPEGLGR